jgi:hypothetical protein
VRRLYRLILRVLFLTPRRKLPIEVDMRLRQYEGERAIRMEGYAATWDRLWAAKASDEAQRRRRSFYGVAR